MTVLGNVLSAAGDTQGAIDAYNDALRVDPNFIWSRRKLVTLLRNIGRDSQADEQQRYIDRQLRQVLGYDPPATSRRSDAVEDSEE